MNTDKLKARYHEKFRKNINNKKPYIPQLLERAWKEYNKHTAFNPYIRTEGATQKDREELKVLNELIKLYQLQIDLKPVKYESC